MAYKLIGKNFTPPDVRAKVTGKARYAEDFRLDGMVFCKMLSSPYPHARVVDIDASEALSMPGVLGMITADDVPAQNGAHEQILSNEPLHVGAPILAIAAETEEQAADAVDKLNISYEQLPFQLDPLEALRPGSAPARSDGNATLLEYRQPAAASYHYWSEEDFNAVSEGELPQGASMKDWAVGDIETGFAESDYIMDESFVVAANSHHSMEPRSTLATWEAGKCHVYGSTQSQAWVNAGLAQYLGIEQQDLVYIAPFCGGGFGSKGSAYPSMAIPAYLSKKINRPVMHRFTRTEEYYLGRARSSFQARAKIGFTNEGKIKAIDLYLIKDAGPNEGFSDIDGASACVNLIYSPDHFRLRAVSPNTNTPPRGPQRGPGHNQMVVSFEPLLDKAAAHLGISRLAIRKINAAQTGSGVGPNQTEISSLYQLEALEKGAIEFDLAEREAVSGPTEDGKVRAVGVGQAYHPAGFNGFDGMLRIDTEGKVHIHTGVGNLGTYSYAGTARVAAEVLGVDWNDVIIHRGDSREGLPLIIGQFGSNTSFTASRTHFAAGTDAADKIKEIAAIDLGGEASDYTLANGQVSRNGSGNDQSLSLGEVAARAIEIGGKYSGQVAPENILPPTVAALKAVEGLGLVGIANDALSKEQEVGAYAAGFVEIELDPKTGQIEILDYLGVADCGTVMHPQSLATQIKGAAVMGFGMAVTEGIAYDPQNGLAANVGLYQAKPPSYLDVPSVMRADALNLPDPQNPVGIKGIGEPVLGCAASALICAVSEALGGYYFKRTPVRTDMIVNAAAGMKLSQSPLQKHSQ
ncbi:MAG: xanthine dehydrogenase family protein molybdopterin-binding subunit [Proteobacteria bacterium]|jgi:CO/xanthine dehydrogenase Mo-binding subunit|nr:xanthine dehydrogenase family protein molybdopterin-binding subunit [Pseudomonadota bacterium]